MSLLSKVFVLLYLCIIGTALVQAQPEFTVQNIPKVGNFYPLRYCDTVNVAIQSGGAAQTWDYRSLRPQTRISTIRYLRPDQTPFAADFPGATLVMRTDTSHVFFQVSGNTLTKLGSVAQDKSKELLLADPYDIGPLPIKYLQRYKDDFRGNFVRVNPSSTVARGGNGEYSYDGFGTLSLPDNVTINNVMRIVSTHISADTAISGAFKTVGTTKITTYQWIARDSINPSLVITEIENTFALNNQVISTKRSKVVQLDPRRPSPVTTTTESSEIGINLSLTPNPAWEQSILHYWVEDQGVITIEIVDILGNNLWQHSVEAEKGEQSLSLNLQPFASGIYYLRLRSGTSTQITTPLHIVR